MKILNFLAINVVIVNAQDINLSVRVVKYKDENDNVVTLADSEGTSMAVRFLNADTEEDNNVEVSWVINITLICKFPGQIVNFRIFGYD